jgi:ADP-ribose pyrophosphatase YjhB (NUDIX family)
VNGLGVGPAGTVILARHSFGAPQWRLLGGFIQRDESLQDALRREIAEETGFRIEVGPILEANTGHRWARVEAIYAYRVIGGRAALSEELLELREFSPDTLPPMRADHRGIVERHFGTAVAWARGRRDPATIAV